MSVVSCESTRKMTPKNKLLVLIVVIGWSESIAGTAFSNVIVQRGEVVPVEYIKYNPSSLPYTNAQISTAPLESAIPVASIPAIVSPCLAPCIIPNTPGPEVTPVSANAKIIAYKSPVPNTPAVTNKNAATGYQYAYAVFDDQTGDKKSQIERSDGSVVQGQYSFIQPDGFRREVVYTADDLKGFNAIVRNISPEPKQSKESKEEEVKTQPTPCPESQNEHLTNQKNDASSSEEIHVGVERPKKHKCDIISKEKSAKTVVAKPEENEKKPPKAVESIESSASTSESAESQAMESVDSNVPVSNNVISYSDVIKCLQAKLQGTNIAVSPLTYVLIPSLRGLC